MWGSGQTLDYRPKGSDAEGMISEEETVSIKIPAGVEQGMQLKVSGKEMPPMAMVFQEI